MTRVRGKRRTSHVDIGNGLLQMEYPRRPGIAWVMEVFLLDDNSQLGAQISNVGFHINAKNSFFAITVKKK